MLRGEVYILGPGHSCGRCCCKVMITISKSPAGIDGYDWNCKCVACERIMITQSKQDGLKQLDDRIAKFICYVI